jgi:secreted Zn-dependent insulinase-like peptidase
LFRIDEFLGSFRETLLAMPESEIQNHASALSKKLLKPIQKLGQEASSQFSKTHRYAPEVLANGGTDNDPPWESVKTLAHEIQSLGCDDLLQTWD